MALIAIVRPPLILPQGMMNVSQGVPPIGVAYLAGSLKADGHEVVVIDAFGSAVERYSKLDNTGLLINGLIAKDIVEMIPRDVDIIGISCMYSNEWIYYSDVIQDIVARFPNNPVIAGGEHITADPEYSLRGCPGLDVCVLGEGEVTFLNLVGALSGDQPLELVKGIAFLNSNGMFEKTSAQPRITAVDEIPVPAWDEIPLENYLSNGLGMATTGKRSMPMLASRGCPYQCKFCSARKMWRQKWVVRDPKLVVEEMKMWVDKYEVDHIEFYDLSAIVRKSWVIEFADILLKENLNVTWACPSGTRSEALDWEVCDRLYSSGCHDLVYAPESGSPETLKRIKKKINIPKMLKSMRVATNCGIHLKANLIIGFPGQTMMEVVESYWFIVKMAWVGVRDVAVFPLVPYPGSDLFSQLVEQGKIKKSSPLHETFLSGNVYNEVSGMKSWSEHISDRQLKFLTVGGMISFYVLQFLFRPWRVFGSLGRIACHTHRTMLERLIEAVVHNFVQGRRLKVEATETTRLVNNNRSVDR